VKAELQLSSIRLDFQPHENLIEDRVVEYVALFDVARFFHRSESALTARIIFVLTALMGRFRLGNRQVHIQRGFVVGHVDEVKTINSFSDASGQHQHQPIDVAGTFSIQQLIELKMSTNHLDVKRLLPSPGGAAKQLATSLRIAFAKFSRLAGASSVIG
jgi:hypothetical protein